MSRARNLANLNAPVTPASIGLGNVSNTSDASKPISTATQAALDAKASSAAITAERTASITLTNKTIEAATFTNGYTEETLTANTGTAYTVDLANGTLQILTLTGNCTFTFPTPTAGRSLTIFLKQDGTGGRTSTWPSTVKWPASVTPDLTTVASKGDKLTFTADGTYWWATVAGLKYL